MLEQLMDLVREHAQGAVVNNPAIPNDQNEAVMGAAATSITTGLQQELASGNAAGVLSLLGAGGNTAGETGNSIVNNISNNFIGTLLEKFNLDKGAAQQLATSLIPTVMGALVHKTNDASNNNFSLDGIINSLTGGSAQGINLQGILGKLSGGLDKNGDGHVDLEDLKSLLSNGAQQQQQQQNNNDSIGGFLKNLLG
ncbi:hypothetical protein ACDQ55_02260 [Chitinophaga sp. 30R24]|uniref:hypothetical protein n=1 Tax=Chitinophaga sp. 30R24 TaxID=3248838 RepID=UPI003B919D98